MGKSLTSLLKIKRKDAGLTQEAVAEKLRVSTNSVQNWESGKAKPKYENLSHLSRIYNIPINDFYEAIQRDIQNGDIDNWPEFLFEEDVNDFVHTLRLNHNQQELLGILYIIDYENLTSGRIYENEDYLPELFEKVPFEFINKVGSIHFINIAEGLQKVLMSVRPEFLINVLKNNPDEEFALCRLSKEQICEFLDAGIVRDDFWEWDVAVTNIELNFKMKSVKGLLKTLNERKSVLFADGWMAPIREDVPDEIKRNFPIQKDGKHIFNNYYCEEIIEYSNVGSKNGNVEMKINDTGRKLLEWFET